MTDPIALAREASRLLNAGSNPQALILVQQGLAATPQHPALLSLHGVALAALGRVPEAIAAAEASVAVAPRWADGLANLGHVLEQDGQLQPAAAAYERALESDAEHFAAAMSLGILLARAGRRDEAVQRFRQALASQPGHPAAQQNLALALKQNGERVESLALFRQVFASDATQVEAANQAVAILMQELQPQQALELLDRALQHRPDHARSHNNRGTALRAMGRVDESLAAYREATRLAPDHADAWRNLGLLAADHSLIEEAAAAFTTVLRIMPGDAVASHMLNAVEGRTTARPPQSYVARSFDTFADSFDHQLGNLGYRVPHSLVAVLDALAPGRRFQRALDLGCGTGLVAVALAERVADWSGVDLSPRMLQRADARGLYARLAEGDVVEVLQADAARYDLITCADVMIYLGDLAPLFAAVAAHLTPDGLFLCSIERHDDDSQDSRLTVSGRYAQSDGYIARLAAASGLDIRHREATVVRQEHSQPVAGSLFALAPKR